LLFFGLQFSLSVSFFLVDQALVNLKTDPFILDAVAINSILGSFIGTDDEDTLFTFFESTRKGTPGKVNATTYAVVTRFVVVKLDQTYQKLCECTLPSFSLSLSLFFMPSFL